MTTYKCDDQLQRWVGKWPERWLFSVMPLDGGDKVLFLSPYDYERSTLQLLDNEEVIARWRARVEALLHKRRGKWPDGFCAPHGWESPPPRRERQTCIEALREEADAFAAAAEGDNVVM